MGKTNHYLKPNRLADVIALLQVLALDEDTAHPSLDTLFDNLQGEPKSGGHWGTIAEEHPEFFRFNRDKYEGKGKYGSGIPNDRTKRTVSLSARHVTRKIAVGEDGDQVREPISTELLTKLIETAVQLHDKQRERADWWKSWIPLVAVLLTVLATLYVNHLQLSNRTEKNLKGAKYYILKVEPEQ